MRGFFIRVRAVVVELHEQSEREVQAVLSEEGKPSLMSGVPRK